MSEYSVEEVRAHARMLRECRINTEATRDRQQDKLADICDAYADLLERIAADESAVCSPMLTKCPRCKNSHSVALADPKCWLTRPPAQAAQETPCSLNEALAVIEAWADRGNRLDGDDAPRLRAIADRIAPTAEPVAQGEAVGFITDEGVGGAFARFTEEGHKLPAGTKLYAAQPRAVPKLDAEDWAVLQRLRNALPDVGLNGWHRGVTVLSKLLAAAPSPGESE